jgi:hypothetical protein
VTLASARVTRFTPVAVTLGRGSGSIRSGGWGTTWLRFSPGVRNRLRRDGRLRLVVYGYAVSIGSAPTVPKAEQLTLT